MVPQASPTIPDPLTTVRATLRTAPILHVVDDEPTIQQLFRQMAQFEDLEVRTYGDARQFLDAYDPARPGCLVLDLNLPDMSGLQLLEELARCQLPIPVVFMSGMARVTEAVSALKLGSLDFVEKPFSVADMMAAVRRALAHDQQNRQQRLLQQGLRARLAQLTPRETEVMDLVVQGMPNKTIAATLGVSPKTVEVHRANVMRKTGVGSLAELVKLALATSKG